MTFPSKRSGSIGELDVDYRFHVRIPSNAPEADAQRLVDFLEDREFELVQIAYSRGEVPERRWWESGHGAVVSRPEALGSRRWAVGYTRSSLILRLDVPHFPQTRQYKDGLFRWRLVSGTDQHRQGLYGQKAMELICQALDLEPSDLDIEPQMVY